MAGWLVDDTVNGFLRCQGCCIVALLIGVMGGNVFQRSFKKTKVLKTLKNKIWNNYSLLLKKNLWTQISIWRNIQLLAIPDIW